MRRVWKDVPGSQVQPFGLPAFAFLPASRGAGAGCQRVGGWPVSGPRRHPGDPKLLPALFLLASGAPAPSRQLGLGGP